jgi:hypothetical protein
VSHLSSHLFFGAKTTSLIVQVYHLFLSILFKISDIVFKTKKYGFLLKVYFSTANLWKDVAGWWLRYYLKVIKTDGLMSVHHIPCSSDDNFARSSRHTRLAKIKACCLFETQFPMKRPWTCPLLYVFLFIIFHHQLMFVFQNALLDQLQYAWYHEWCHSVRKISYSGFQFRRLKTVLSFLSSNSYRTFNAGGKEVRFHQNNSYAFSCQMDELENFCCG